MNPHSSKHFLYFRAIQGRSGGTLVDPTLQDNVLLPDDFAEYIYHIGNAHDMHSTIEGGLIPGGRGLSVFHSREPDVCQSRSGRSSIRSGQTQNRGVQKHLENVTKCSFLKLAQRKGLQFYQSRSHAIAKQPTNQPTTTTTNQPQHHSPQPPQPTQLTQVVCAQTCPLFCESLVAMDTSGQPVTGAAQRRKQRRLRS